jgi:hypothetical protein
VICQHCTTVNPETATRCVKCGHEVWPWDHAAPGGTSSAAANPALRMLVPIGRSWLAILAGYLGILSLLLVPAPFALVTGILALGHLKKNPQLYGKGRAWFGIVAGSLGTIVLGIVIVNALMKP